MNNTKNAKTTHGDFGNGSVKKLILNQALPLTLAQLVQLLYNIVDRIYIGHMPGDDAGMALTGLGLCFPIITLISSCVNLVVGGSAPLCSIARGKGDKEKAHNIMSTAFSLLILISIGVAVVIFLTRRPLLYLLGASDITYPYAENYITIYLLGTLFFAIGTGMNNFINLQGYPKIGMLTTVIGAVINLILDPIFIFVFKMGVAGAAIATVISQFCSALWVIFFLVNKERELRLSLKSLTIKKELLSDMLLLGIPGFVMGATNCAVQSVCNATLSIHGGDIYVAIMTIINSVREITGLPVNGISQGSQPVLSFNYGAKNRERVRSGIRFTTLLGFLYTVVFWIAVMAFPSFFIRIFSDDTSTLSLGITPLIVYFSGFCFMSLQYSGQSTFVALGKAGRAIFFSIFRKIIIVVPLTILLPRIPSLGVMGVFWAEPISNFIGGSASFLTMYFTVYRKLKSDIKDN